jgi:hypothetical protein
MAAAVGSIGMGATLAGGIMGAVGAEKTGAAQQQMYNYQAGVARINSQIDLQNKEYALNQGEIQATQFGLKEAQQEAGIRVAQSASGLDVNSGSNVDVQRSQRQLGQMDMTQIRSNAAKTAYDFDVKSTMDLNQSTMDVMAGQNAKTAGDINAMTSIIGSVGSVSSKWMQGNAAGMWGTSSGPGFVSGL